MRRKKKSKKKLTLLTKLCILADLLAITCFIIFYGPWDGFRNLFINTALKTKDHLYLAKVFYSDEAIQVIKKEKLDVYDFDYSKTLDEILKRNLYNEAYLEDYLNF